VAGGDVIAGAQGAAGGGAVARADLLENLHPARFRQGLGDQFGLARGECRHGLKMALLAGGYKFLAAFCRQTREKGPGAYA